MNSLFHKLWEKAAFDHLPPANLSPCLPFHLSHWNQRLLRSQTRLVEHRVVEKRPEFVYWNSRSDGNSEDSPELQNILLMHLLSSSSFPVSELFWNHSPRPEKNSFFQGSPHHLLHQLFSHMAKRLLFWNLTCTTH